MSEHLEKAKELNKKVSSLKGTNPAQTLSELEAESESRTDRLLDELADNMAKADEAMKPDKPLEQGEFTKTARQIIEEWGTLGKPMSLEACDIIDHQAAEIERLKEELKQTEPLIEFFVPSVIRNIMHWPKGKT